MITNPYFRVGTVTDTPYFNEARVEPTLTHATVINSGSINTSAIDAYRQGIEITDIKYYDAGIIKIHAGEPGHIWRDNRYGLGKGLRSDIDAFEESTPFNPVGYIIDQEDGIVTDYTYPIITRDFNAATNYDTNGIIEPITIRAKASFYSIDSPFEAHDVHATFIGGNEHRANGSDRVLSIDYFTPHPDPTPFYDLVDMMGNIPTTAYFDTFTAKILPYVEAPLLPRGVPIQASYDNDMVVALMKFGTTGSISGTLNTDNYVRYNQIAAPCGWTYDNTAVGTDSLSFGGFFQ